MKSKLTKVVSLVMAVAIIISLAMPFASAAKKQTNYGVAYSNATGNADNATMPANLMELKAGKTVYFNFQVDSSQKLKWVKVHVAYDDFNPVWEKKDPANNYMRYTTELSYKIPKSRAGCDLQYYFDVRYTDGTTKRFPEGDWWFYAEVK